MPAAPVLAPASPPAAAVLAAAAPVAPPAPAAVPPPAAATPPETAAPPPPAPAPAAAIPPPPSAEASTEAFSSPASATGRISASAARCRRTSSSKAAQPGQRSMWARVRLRGRILPWMVATSSRTSTQELSRARRPRTSASRAWKMSAFTFSRRTPSTSAISMCDSSPSSNRTSAARWSDGRRWISWSSSASCSRSSTWSAGPSGHERSAAGAPTQTTSRRSRSSERQRLRAIV